jgi:hypothetical protein
MLPLTVEFFDSQINEKSTVINLSLVTPLSADLLLSEVSLACCKYFLPSLAEMWPVFLDNTITDQWQIKRVCLIFQLLLMVSRKIKKRWPIVLISLPVTTTHKDPVRT